MDKFLEFKKEYQSLKEEFETYQSFAESTIHMINKKNYSLEKKLDAITNIVRISEYINLNVSDEKLIPMINDMIIGILGVSYSSIYIKRDNKFEIKATNINIENFEKYEENFYKIMRTHKPFVINCKDLTHKQLNSENINAHSIIGVPISLRGRIIGYIVVEHKLWDFFSTEHVEFISAIANPIGIALENNMLYRKIKENAVRDPLLGVYNRKYFFETLGRIIDDDPHKKFAIFMFDIDDFKQCNDKYGHQFGDQVLIEISKIILDNITNKDIFARYGGEEFVVYIDEYTCRESIIDKVEDIRIKVSRKKVIYKDIQDTVSASFGISFFPENGENIEKVINIADKRLYIAKNSGKNRVVTA